MEEVSRNMVHNFKKIKLFVYDFDGVMTDNTFILDCDGNEQVVLNRSDGLAVAEIKKKGFMQLILSSENSEIINRRANKLKIGSIKGADNKLLILTNYLESNNLNFNEILYVGNDINDLDAMSNAKIKICPNDAAIEIKNISDIILQTPGGKGVIREVLRLFKS